MRAAPSCITWRFRSFNTDYCHRVGIEKFHGRIAVPDGLEGNESRHVVIALKQLACLTGYVDEQKGLLLAEIDGTRTALC